MLGQPILIQVVKEKKNRFMELENVLLFTRSNLYRTVCILPTTSRSSPQRSALFFHPVNVAT